MPNAWDVGSAGLLAWLGFEALATTSSGHAATLGRLDGGVTRDEALAHAAALCAGSDLPVSADLENAFADDPDGVAETIRRACQTGLAGCSVEDYSGRCRGPDLRARPGPRAGRCRRRGRARRAGQDGAHRPRREPHPRPRRPRRHDRAPSGLSGGRRRRAVRARPDQRAGHPDASSNRSTGRSTCWRCAARRARGRAGRARGRSRLGRRARSPSPRCGALREAAEELRDQGTYGYLERTALGVQAARSAFRRER